MTPSDIVCRACRNAYNIPEGCAICESAKRNIVWPDPVQGNDETISVAKQMMRILQNQLDRLESEIKQVPHRGYSPQLATEAKKLAQALGLMVKETRQLEAQARRDAESMDWSEKAELVLQMFTTAPPEFKKTVLEGALAQMEAHDAPGPVFDASN